MMQYLFPHFQYAAVITAIIASILIGFISYGLVFRTSLFDFLIDQPFVASFVTMPATMFALLMAFMASSVWQNTLLARTSLWNERLAIESISRLSIEPEALEMKISRGLLHYVDVVIHEEWGANFNQKASIDADRAIIKLEEDVWALEREYCSASEKRADCSSSFIASAFLRYLEQLKLAREERLTLGNKANLGYISQWLAVYFLGMFAAINIAAGHKKSRKTAIVAVIIYCTCAAILYTTVALNIHPYKGPHELSPTLLIQNIKLEK
jgi:hypothetical protein